MKAAIQTRYGAPDVLQLAELQKPSPREDEVLVKVHATTVSVVDCTFRKGDSYMARMFTGLLRPKFPIQGGDFAGEIEAVGKGVTRFQVGDKVFGATKEGFGAYTEYICLSEDASIVLKPKNLTYEEAAAIPYGALTALPFLRDEAQLEAGQKILINGASGSVGIMAVQLAKYYGAEVTGVCSSANVSFVREHGADKVVDYTKEDFTKSGELYDVIFDSPGKSSFGRSQRSLKKGGIYLTAVLSLGILFRILWTSLFGSKRAKIAFTGLREQEDKIKDLHFLRDLAEQEIIKPSIDKQFSLEQISSAHRYVDTGRKQGNVVIQVAA